MKCSHGEGAVEHDYRRPFCPVVPVVIPVLSDEPGEGDPGVVAALLAAGGAAAQPKRFR